MTTVSTPFSKSFVISLVRCGRGGGRFAGAFHRDVKNPHDWAFSGDPPAPPPLLRRVMDGMAMGDKRACTMTKVMASIDNVAHCGR
jgi:hypothetical protein